jgi:competence protein ComEC
MNVLHFPLTKITFGFIFGIVLCSLFSPTPNFVFLCLFVSLTGLIISFYWAKKQFNQTHYFGILAIIVSFFIGMTSQIIHDDSYKKDNYYNQISNFEAPHDLQIVLYERLRSSKKNARYIATVNYLDHQKSSGKILLNIEGASDYIPIGSQIIITEKIFKNKKPSNPDQFDYSKYLKNQSVFAQVYVSAKALKISPKIQKNIRYYSDLLRNNSIENLKENGFGKRELPVISALILGQQQEIGKDILQDYQYAGAIHILSVSGLHIGFILFFITFLLRVLPKNKNGNRIRLLAILIGLWGFAIIAGLAPSVVRSATMFSFVAIGMNLKRSTNIFHTLLVSLLLILLFKPSFLFDVGFQLSYLSLFFIIWLQPLLASIWSPKNKIVLYFWDILTVSFAAQIGAFPLSMYYFHQFPGLFFITNIIILPFLILIMGLGVFVMVLAALNYVPQFPLRVLEWFVSSLNSFIKWIASFEDFIFKDISFNKLMLFGLYIALFSVILWFKKPNFNRLILGLFSIILFQGIYFGSRWKNQQELEWIVFNSNKNTIITKRIGEEVDLYCSELNQKKLINPVVTTYLVAHFSKIRSIKAVSNLEYFNHSKILILDSLGVYPKKGNPDVLLITHSPKFNLTRFIQTNRPKIIVADGSNYTTYVALWKATCEKEKIPFHSTREKGFFKLN